jgi:hypothetical protein
MHEFVVRSQTRGPASPPSGVSAFVQPPHSLTMPEHGSLTGPHLPVQSMLSASAHAEGVPVSVALAPSLG